MSDFDEDDSLSDEIKELDETLATLMDCDLSAWDTDFVNDLVERIEKYGNRTNITNKQNEQIERMKRQYGLGEGTNKYKGQCGYPTYRVSQRNKEK